MSLHPLINIEVQRYYPNKPKFNGVCPINNLPKSRMGHMYLNLGEFKSIWTHWLALYVNDNSIMVITILLAFLESKIFQEELKNS